MAEQERNKRFPQYLSKPIQVLWFETDELILFVFTLTLALLYGKIMWLIFLVTQYFYTVSGTLTALHGPGSDQLLRRNIPRQQGLVVFQGYSHR